MKVFLAGEGTHELGDWAKEPQYRGDAPVAGCLEILLRRVVPEGWSVADAKRWKNIRKYRAGVHLAPEAHNVRAVALDAVEAGCDALVFSRDEDGDETRESAIREGLDRARSERPQLRIVGGLAIRTLDAWVLAAKRHLESELVTDPKATLADQYGIETREHRTDCLEACELERIPDDAKSLLNWLEQARTLVSAE